MINKVKSISSIYILGSHFMRLSIIALLENCFFFQTNSFSKCNTCTKLDAQLQATRDPIKRDEIKGLIKAHNYRQM